MPALLIRPNISAEVSIISEQITLSLFFVACLISRTFKNTFKRAFIYLFIELNQIKYMNDLQLSPFLLEMHQMPKCNIIFSVYNTNVYFSVTSLHHAVTFM